jgi:cytochrome c oxidase cbb3-type subunit III
MIDKMKPGILRSSINRSALWCVTASAFCAAVLIFGQSAAAQKPQNSGTAAQAARPPAVDARPIFESSCAGCHGLDGRGGERGPDLSTRQQVVQLSDVELLQILRKGRPSAGMPPFDSLGGDNLKALVAYLRALQGKGAATALPGDQMRGKSLFFGKARCSECHMLRGKGGFIGRDLSNYGATLSAAEIHSNLLRPGDTSDKSNKLAVVTMRDEGRFTGIIRNEDNFSIQLQSLDGAFHFLTKLDVTRLEFRPEPVMPADYATTLKPAELDDLVSYLLSVSMPEKSAKKANWEEEE